MPTNICVFLERDGGGEGTYDLVGHCKDFSFTLRLKSERDWKPLGNLKQRNDVILWWDSGLFQSRYDRIC